MKEQLNSLNDGGGIRNIRARWVITADLTLDTAAHFGGNGDSAVDMTVQRDRVSGAPLLPGTTLAGALRSHLADVLEGYNTGVESRTVEGLFGGGRRNDYGDQSPLIVFDSLGKLPDGFPVEIRDGVAIKASTGVAAAHKKFDYEVLPPRTRFPLRLDLLVEEDADEQHLVALLAAALEGLESGDIHMGLRRTRGLGALSASAWRVRRFDLSSEAAWLSWLCADPGAPLEPASQASESIRGAIPAAWPAWRGETFKDERSRLCVSLELHCKGGMLVRSPGTTADAPDVSQLSSGGQSVVPGTSIAGVLRNHAVRIAHFVRGEQGDADLWVERMFGPRQDEEQQEKIPLKASRLRVSECRVEQGTRMRPSRIRIDRFSQGVAKGALFDEEPDYGGTFKTVLELRMPREGEIGLLLLLIKDLVSGVIPLGGAASVGRGAIYGTGVIEAADGRRVRLDAKDAESIGGLDAWIAEFHRAALIGGKEEDLS